jgi:hypothetical protein
MPFPISLGQEEYEALVALARRGTLDSHGQVNADEARKLNSYLVMLEKKSGITRYALWVQWQEQDAPLPPGVNFPSSWPPKMREYLALTSRPIMRTDVITVLKNRALNPTNILVTKDPGATVGWTELNAFFK